MDDIPKILPRTQEETEAREYIKARSLRQCERHFQKYIQCREKSMFDLCNTELNAFQDCVTYHKSILKDQFQEEQKKTRQARLLEKIENAKQEARDARDARKKAVAEMREAAMKEQVEKAKMATRSSSKSS